MRSTLKRLIKRTPVLGPLWSSRDQALRDLAGQQTSLGEHQRSLREHQVALARADRSLAEHQAALARAEESLREHQAALRDVNERLANCRSSVEGHPDQPSYDSDDLTTYRKSLELLTEPRFRRAYDKGINSGHLIGPVVNADVGIEFRVHVVLWAAHHAMQLEGDFVECGVNTGICSLAICDYLDWNGRGRTFWLFDTFCGIPDSMVTDAERRMADHYKRAYFDCYELVQDNFRPYTGIRIVKGMVPGTLSQFTGRKVAYLSIDMNIVEPELAAIEFFWNRLEKSAVVVLDDYAWRPHRLQKEALDDFATKKGIMIATLPTGQGLIVK